MLFAITAHAEENNEELLLVVIEVDKFMINWSPSGETLGRAIVYRCAECESEIMTFDANTEFYINEQPRPINEIGKKVDWTGLITVTNKEPSKVIRFTAY
tara:strand:+ start:531 stop:830 length:300 start_codon:yes stop_codon:yes gene_type:complete